MSRTFAYVRVSTTEQNSENQIKEIEDAGINNPAASSGVFLEP
jgi:DNA invertase Pin-like site-specific DNA recombinase